MKATKISLKKLRYIPLIILFIILLSIISYNTISKFHRKNNHSKKSKNVFKLTISEKNKLKFSNTTRPNYLHIYIKDNLGYSEKFDNFKQYFENKYQNIIVIKKNYKETNINDVLNFLFKILGVFIFLTICFINYFIGHINKTTIIFINKYKLLIFVIFLNFFYVFCFSLESFEPFEIKFRRNIIFSKISNGYFPDVKFIENLLLELTQ